ncbi:hypothetical protein Clacol_000723 [Clathrus columnatus]|uniref:Sister chromatid cohesion protein DCC1 n=1 Tax=Clathrus columnatus TaxID=1419009 RepID=A0AAV5A1R2_9AGAM|nr:hypothetical protein Clacol_000723 [Clathrus columnatus]
MSKSKLEFDLYFSSENSSETFKLLELPPELCKLIEEGIEKEFTIRGRPSDDAVFCTSSKTYALRSIALSNIILLATSESAPGTTEKLIIRDEISQLIELIPAVPKLQRLANMLKGCEYDEGHERDEGSEDNNDGDERTIKRARVTRQDVKNEVQASDSELVQGFKEYRILEVDGYLRSLTPAYLTQILETTLNTIISQGFPLPPFSVSIHKLIRELDIEHEYPQTILRQVLPWFGSVDEDEWIMDSSSVVKEIGLGRLRFYKEDPANLNTFIDEWKTAVGDSFAEAVDLKLLEVPGNYLLTPESLNSHISYFPISNLPHSASELFADLFLTRQRWLADDIKPFLSTIAIDNKEKEKLLMKFARATTDSSGCVWYTARAGQI